MKESIYCENIVHLADQLAIESEPARRQKLARRLRLEIDKLEVAGIKTITARQAYDANYWKARAARLRHATGLYQNSFVHDHLMRIAAGYDNLAERACRIQQDAHSTGRSSQG